MTERRREDTDAVDNAIFVQEAQALLTSLGSVKENKLLHKKCYPECVAHVIYDLTDGREPRELRKLTPPIVMHEMIRHQTVGKTYLG